MSKSLQANERDRSRCTWPDVSGFKACYVKISSLPSLAALRIYDNLEISFLQQKARNIVIDGIQKRQAAHLVERAEKQMPYACPFLDRNG